MQHIISGKVALKYQGTEIESMKAVAQASKNRSLAEFQDVSNHRNSVCFWVYTSIKLTGH